MYTDADTDQTTLLHAPGLDPLFWRPTRTSVDSAWTGHVPFAFWLINALKPSVLVELGTHNGVSYSAFCDAVLRSQLSTRCYAVDTWKGDPHAGEYSEDVFTKFSQFHAAHYAGFSELLRCKFEEAADYFPDGSIDLLHIDGYHTYDAVRADFETWRPKCSGRGVVLLHDTNVRGGNFGVWKLFAELSQQYPHFEFLHEHGLGVLAVGSNPPPAIANLCGFMDSNATGVIRERFAVLGERWKSEPQVKSLAMHAQALEHDREVREQHIFRLEKQIEEQNSTPRSCLEQQITIREAEIGRLKAALLADKQMRSRSAARAASARKEAFEARLRLASAENAVSTARAEISALRAKVIDGEAGIVKRERRIAEGEKRIAERETRIAALHARLHQTQLELAHAHAGRDAIESSTAWKATWLLRSVGARLPRWTRRAARGSAKFTWWMLTLQLHRRLAGRRQIVEDSRPEEPHGQPQAETVPLPAPSGSTTEAPVTAASGQRAGTIHRVIYISGEPDTPGARYRVERYAAAARSLGLEVLSFRLDEALPMLPPFTASDLVIVWRAAWDPAVETIAQASRRAGAPFAFDLDDLMMNPNLAQARIIDGIRSQGMAEDHVRQWFQRIHDTMQAADVCIATTEVLAYEIRHYHKTTFVLPNTFDDAAYRSSRFVARWEMMRRDDRIVRIGYAGGTRTHQRDFRLVAAVVADALRARPSCRLVLFREPQPGVPLVDISEFPALQEVGSQIEWRDMVPLVDLPSELARFDINLAPLEVGNRFCEAKSELKFFEAAIAGVCTVASPTEPFRRVIRHGQNGYLADNPAEWAECLDRLLDDPSLRHTMARQAHYDALAGFGPAAARRALASLLEQATPGERAARAFQLDVFAPARRGTMPIEIPPARQVFAADHLGQADVTIVVPVYNYASYVLEALESARLQTLRSLDLVIVDDSSTDNSLDVVMDWARRHTGRFNRLLVLQNEPNAGLGPTRNVGFDAAETPYVLPLDADNRLLPRCCEDLLRALTDSAAASFAYPTIQKFGGSADVIGPSTYHAKRFAGGPYIDAMALVRKEAWAIVRGYADMRAGWEDYDFWCRLAEQGLWGIGVGEVLAEYRVHSRSMLATMTEQAENKLQVLHNFEQRHPWARIVDRPVLYQSAAA